MAQARISSGGISSAPQAPRPPALITALDSEVGLAPAMGARRMGIRRPNPRANELARSRALGTSWSSVVVELWTSACRTGQRGSATRDARGRLECSEARERRLALIRASPRNRRPQRDAPPRSLTSAGTATATWRRACIHHAMHGTGPTGLSQPLAKPIPCAPPPSDCALASGTTTPLPAPSGDIAASSTATAVNTIHPLTRTCHRLHPMRSERLSAGYPRPHRAAVPLVGRTRSRAKKLQQYRTYTRSLVASTGNECCANEQQLWSMTGRYLRLKMPRKRARASRRHDATTESPRIGNGIFLHLCNFSDNNASPSPARPSDLRRSSVQYRRVIQRQLVRLFSDQ